MCLCIIEDERFENSTFFTLNSFFFQTQLVTKWKADLSTEFTINYDFLCDALNSCLIHSDSSICWTNFFLFKLFSAHDSLWEREKMLQSDSFCAYSIGKPSKFKLVSCRFMHSFWFRVQLTIPPFSSGFILCASM